MDYDQIIRQHALGILHTSTGSAMRFCPQDKNSKHTLQARHTYLWLNVDTALPQQMQIQS